jgi:cytoskeletal protein CcmA (bactofilin family)
MAIFEKSGDNDGAVETTPRGIGQARPERSKYVSVTASARSFKGKPASREGLLIEGQLQCLIAHHEKQLTVGEHARVRADIQANTVIVLGQLVGDIYSGGRVSLASGSDVKGNIFCGCIVIENGARFKGKIDTEKLPEVVAMPKESMQDKTGSTGTTAPHVAKPGTHG